MPVASYKSIFLHFQRDLILSPAPICWRFHKAYLPWPELVSWQGNCLLRNVCLLQKLKRTGVAGTRVLRPCFSHSFSGGCSLMCVAGGSLAINEQSSESLGPWQRSTPHRTPKCAAWSSLTCLWLTDNPPLQPVTHWKTWSPVHPKGLS